jgi:hypothetical protein
MERLKDLINQLKEQFDRKAEPSQMLETARLVEAELQLLASQPMPARVIPTKIAVMMPSAARIYAAPPVATYPSEPRKDAANQHNGAHSEDAAGPVAPLEDHPDKRFMPASANVNAVNGTASGPAAAVAAAPVVTAVTQEQPVKEREKPLERGVWPFDPLAEKPTDRFTLSQKAREVNDVIGANGSSLNDKLRSDVSDLKSALNDTPVRDLKKAIGVNDRYVFINQLFRGDEVMYERSIKTINGFRILPEAEYWMERELKVKLGWDENREITRHFYQLVKRRFS